MNKIKLILRNVFIFLFLSFFSVFVNYLLDLAGIDITKWPYTCKLIYIYASELIPWIIVVLIYRKYLKEKFSDFKDNFKSYFDKYIRYYILGLILMSFSNVIVGFITNSDISNNEEVIRKITNILPIYSLISTCLCAPIIEELLYRKTIGDIFNNKWLGIIIGGLLFGGAHVIGTYTNILDVLYVIPYGVLGSVFMYIYYDSDNIYNTMFLHFMHNSILMILYFVSMIN
ncbi:cAAX amino terminal protease family protein [Clostridium sp. CAG:1193]|nr:cAAX amino terminal protease family protein [Clostridium sp. CAG:1193]